MYIKQIIIQGFKSYREQTVVEPFDPGHNVVVGRNGSGKSNFFYAIQFVLSDEYSHLRPEQRQALLHEGTGPKVMSAFVEIIFDNSDGRLPIDKDEVFLRRVIGGKKDNYFLNKRMVPRSEVMNLLESAGFSRANPYYIVKQGKINQMATAPDSHRLKLLREVAGTKVYDERREESKQILKDTESKAEKIEECLKTIEDRLTTLEEEKEELKEYQKYDKMRRALEYTIHDRELQETRKKLSEMENKRKNSGEEAERLRNDLQDAQDNAKTASKEVKDLKGKESGAKEERDVLNTDVQSQTKDKTRLEFVIKDLKDEVTGDNKSKDRAEQELVKLRADIGSKEKELQKIKPKYEEMKKKEDECTRELALKEQKRKELYAKQGRGSQFSNKGQRDDWIKKELKSLNKQITDKGGQIEKLGQDLKREASRKVELDKKIDEATGEQDSFRTHIDDHNKGFYELKKKKDLLQTERNDLCRKEMNLQQSLSALKEELAKAEQTLRSMAGKPILNGRDSVKKVLQIFRDKGGQYAKTAAMYHGLVIENFKCEQSIYTAVEVTAGNRLFHHIVEKDTVGTMILKEMNKQKLPGEVTFMPLNRLHSINPKYPDSKDAIPMVSKLEYDDQCDKVLRYIFGRTLISRNLEIATKMSQEYHFDCVTLDGDQVSSKGSLTGGYFNKSRSRLEIQKNRSEKKEEIEEQEDQMKKLRGKLNDIESEINKVVADMQKTETKNSKAKDVFDKVKTDVRLMKEELNNIERNQNPKERSLNALKASLESMQTSKEGLESELNQELLATLSSGDQHEVDSLNDSIRLLKQDNKKAFAERMRLEAQKNKLENLLTNNLNRRKDELVQALQEISVEDRKRTLENSQAELKDLTERIESTGTNLKGLDKKLAEIQKKRKKAQVELESYRLKEREIADKIEEDAKELEKMASKQTVFQAKIEECTKKIRELGSLPTDAFSKYKNMSQKQLFKQLEKANLELKKYSHVNKKALDQFISFSEEKEKLMSRKEELDRGHKKIQDLMDVLEQRKFEAILFTFKQVSKYFQEVFKKLVPIGHGTLSIKRDKDDDAGDSHEDQAHRLENATGVSCSVSFTGRNAEMKEMSQLSGGQKSLVAMAMIFAIQKCDPAPFYLFDEIDAALDAQHRKAVADMIHELAEGAQFITTTFRAELLEHASKFYGVKFRNKVSHVDCVTRDDAYDFVEDDATQA